MGSKQRKKSKKKLVIWSIIGLLVIALASALLFTPKGSADFEEEKAQVGDITTFYSFSGSVEAKNRKIMTSEKAMQIDEIKVEVGEKVKRGDELMVTKMGDKIKASINGEVSKIYIGENAELMSGAQLIEIVDYSNVKTTVRVDEYDLKYLKVGQKVNVTINALDKAINGKVSSISKEATNENGVSYFTATIDLSKDNTIRVGMSAEAKILKQKATRVTTLSMQAIQFDSKKKPYVLIPSEKGLPTKKYIQTGINDGTTIEIKSGISVGNAVMVSNKDDGNSSAAMMHGGNQ